MTFPSPEQIAWRLRRDATRDRCASRLWAGFRLELTFGPYELALGPARAQWAETQARAVFRELYGKDPPTVDAATSHAHQKDLFHLSASWRGRGDREEAERDLAALVVALGVPEKERTGVSPLRWGFANGRQAPAVTHWVWHAKDEARP